MNSQINCPDYRRCDRGHNITLTGRFHLHISYRYIKYFIDYYTVSFNSRDWQLHSSVRSLRLSAVCFACHGNANTENIYSGCRTNAVAEASYDWARSSAVSSPLSSPFTCRRLTQMKNFPNFACFSAIATVFLSKELIGRDSLCCEFGQVRFRIRKLRVESL